MLNLKFLPLSKISFIASISPAQVFLFLIFTLSLLLIVYITYKLITIYFQIKQNFVLLEIRPPQQSLQSAYSTQQLFTLIHSLGKQKPFFSRLFAPTRYSFEIVSTKEEGIRYIIYSPLEEADLIKKFLISYLPSVKITQVNEYLPESFGKHLDIAEVKLSNNSCYPLRKQVILEEHDPIAYITGTMTKLNQNEMASFQLILTPLGKISGQGSAIIFMAKLALSLIMLPLGIGLYLLSNGNTGRILPFDLLPQSGKKGLSEEEKEKKILIKEKINQALFKASIRFLMKTENKQDKKTKQKGFLSSLAPFSNPPYQSLILKKGLIVFKSFSLFLFKKRVLALTGNPILSVSEVSDIYHFPFTLTTKTENLVRLYSKELPAPLSLKRSKDLDAVFGKNTYGGTITDIGLTEEERQTHAYILGRTGSGKTTLMSSMMRQDIQKGKGLAFIDPHGDAAEDLLSRVPLSRKDDLIYVNPIDLKFPIGINILELTPDLEEDAAELEKEVVTEGVVSLFRKVFSKEEGANAHRIEYILRNTIYSAYYVPNRTIFTISKILTNPKFRREVLSKIDDEDLIDFWKYEFGKAGDYQVIKMTQGVTAKVGRFLRSPTARRILEQVKSTLNFDDIINQSKILICNFSQGKLGEDTSRLLGITIMTKLQQAALKRAYIPENERKVFYLYVDEFQNFATGSFTKMITEGRKYRMPLVIAEQSTSQQRDKDTTNIILANVTTLITFRSGNYLDEELMLNQFSPYLKAGEIMNLPRYHFFIKMSAIESEEPFTGVTISEPVQKDIQKIEELIASSRKNWAIQYSKPVNKLIEVISRKSQQIPVRSKKDEAAKSFVPDEVDD